MILCNFHSGLYSMERNGIPLCFTMFSLWLLYPIIARIKYDVKDLKYIILYVFPLQPLLQWKNIKYYFFISFHTVVLMITIS